MFLRSVLAEGIAYAARSAPDKIKDKSGKKEQYGDNTRLYPHLQIPVMRACGVFSGITGIMLAKVIIIWVDHNKGIRTASKQKVVL